MVVTQEAPFSGWKGMDPKLIPKFEERQQEGIARDLPSGKCFLAIGGGNFYRNL